MAGHAVVSGLDKPFAVVGWTTDGQADLWEGFDTEEAAKERFMAFAVECSYVVRSGGRCAFQKDEGTGQLDHVALSFHEVSGLETKPVR